MTDKKGKPHKGKKKSKMRNLEKDLEKENFKPER